MTWMEIIEGIGLMDGTAVAGLWAFLTKRNKNRSEVKIAEINKDNGDFESLQKRFKELEASHAETLRLSKFYLENFDVVMMQLKSIRDVMHCVDPIMKYQCEKEPHLAIVYDRWSKILNMDNTDLGRD